MKLRKYQFIILSAISIIFSSLPLVATEVVETSSTSLVKESEAPLVRKKKRRRKKRKKVDPKLKEARAEVKAKQIYSGGVSKLISNHEPLPFSIVPLMIRFKRGDNTLTQVDMNDLYYNYSEIPLPNSLKQIKIENLNIAIAQRKFDLALAICKEQLRFMPLDLTLLGKTCEIAHHQKDEAYKNYVWQLTELLYTISESGDGKTPETAFRLHKILDILRFEDLWLNTKQEDILEMKIHPLEQGNLVKLAYKDKEGQKQFRYYKLSQPNNQ